jgi:Ca-activated chloride channel homolog
VLDPAGIAQPDVRESWYSRPCSHIAFGFVQRAIVPGVVDAQAAFSRGTAMRRLSAVDFVSEALSRDFWALVALAAVSLVSFTRAHPQSCAKCGLPETSEMASQWSIKKQVNEVNVFFVAAQGSELVRDLSKNEVQVRDDNKPPAAILGFRTEKELPLRIALLIDTSASLDSRFRFEQAAASAFLRQALSRTDDQAFVMGFSDDQKLIQDFTHDPDLLAHGVEQLTIGGGTALYDAVGSSCQKLLRHPEQHVVARVLVIWSDGESNAGALHLKDAIDIAQRTEATVYTISTHPPVILGDEQDAASVEGNKNLRRLAEETGGRALLPATPTEITSAFEKVAAELRSRYAVSYRPADFSDNGRYRKITIEARKAGRKLRVRSRKGYYARSSWRDDSAGIVPNMPSTLAPKNQPTN